MCTFFLFQLVLIFSVTELGVGWEVLKWDYVMLCSVVIFMTLNVFGSAYMFSANALSICVSVSSNCLMLMFQ